MIIPRPLVTVLTILLALLPQVNSACGSETREAVWAGRFYPADSATLTADLARLCGQARQGAFAKPAGQTLKALILPHAGYIYSGPTAAHAALVLEKNQFDKVILLGPDHRIGLLNGGISDTDSYRTPLGSIALHADAGRLLQQKELFRPIRGAEDTEHSLEVILPFLQYLIGDFALVPVVLGPGSSEPITSALEPLLNPKTLLVVSSDLSHYLPYREAESRDQRTISHILGLDAQSLAKNDNSACGSFPLQVLINLARRQNWKPVLLHYANSGDTAGDRDRVVGYAAIAFYGDTTNMDNKNDTAHAISAEQGKILLTLVRLTIAHRLGLSVAADERKKNEDQMRDRIFQQDRGTFVTLHRHGQLRGCIGTIAPVESIATGIRRNAVNAAFGDPRFPPLTSSEFNEIDIEVSILTDPQPLAYTDGKDLLAKLRPNVDGVILRDGMAGSTFLPQVWEQLPRTEDFLSHLCQKAGLSPNAWQSGRLEVQTYQVQHFSE